MTERDKRDQQSVEEFRPLADEAVLRLDEREFRDYMGDRLHHIMTTSPELARQLRERFASAKVLDDPFDFVDPSGMEIELYRNPHADNPNECEFSLRERPTPEDSIGFVVNTLVIHPAYLYIQQEVRADETDQIPVRDDWYESADSHQHGHTFAGLKSIAEMKLLSLRVLDDLQKILKVDQVTPANQVCV